MSATVRNAMVAVQQEQVPGVEVVGIASTAEAWWAECSDCGRRSRAFLVGMFSAPAAEAHTEAETHDCSLDGYFSTTEKAWSSFKSMLFGPASWRDRESHNSESPDTPKEEQR